MHWTFAAAHCAQAVVMNRCTHQKIEMIFTRQRLFGSRAGIPARRTFQYVSFRNDSSLVAGSYYGQYTFVHGCYLKKALETNKKSKRIRGASTISQQVAKNVFLWQGRSWFRKGLEGYFTFMIELFWSKERILEMYLNVAEMGKGIFGVEAAARTYFKKPASKLTYTESISDFDTKQLRTLFENLHLHKSLLMYYFLLLARFLPFVSLNSGLRCH